MAVRIMNAAGSCKTLGDVEKLTRSTVDEIVVGSITVAPRGGNEGNVLWGDSLASLNSLGLPNGGLPYYTTHLPKMVDIAHASGKKLRASVSPFSLDDMVPLVQCADRSGADSIEVNLSCPNVWQGQGQKPMVGFDPIAASRYLGTAFSWSLRGRRIWAKLPPYSDPFQLGIMADAMNALDDSNPGRLGVVSCNTFPNGFAFENAVQAITNGAGLAGVAGRAMKHIALGQVRQFSSLLNRNIPVNGVGGISRGIDMLDMLDAGAVAVQVNTAYTTGGENPRVFSDILEEFAELPGAPRFLEERSLAV